jgi:hypothetical protein
MGNLSIVVGCNYTAASLKKKSNLEANFDSHFKCLLPWRCLLLCHVAGTEISAYSLTYKPSSPSNSWQILPLDNDFMQITVVSLGKKSSFEKVPVHIFFKPEVYNLRTCLRTDHNFQDI